MKFTTELHGGVCHRTPTPHKSGTKKKWKKKKIETREGKHPTLFNERE